MRINALACAFTLAAGLTAPTVSAQGTNINREMALTFSSDVRVPGQVLPAGSYIFRIENPMTTSTYVRVTTGDRQESFGYFIVRRERMANRVEDATVRFHEASAGHPPAIRDWWYPGHKMGFAPVYSNVSEIATAD